MMILAIARARPTRRIAVLLALAALASASVAQSLAPRPVHLVLGLPAGGGADVIARLVARGLADALGRQVVVENRPGASGIIAADAVAKAPPDGSTLLLGGSALVLPPAFGKALPFDPAADLEPVARVATVPAVLVVGAASPFHSTGELIAYARQHPRGLNYASAGNGSSLDLFMKMFELRTGTQLTHVPYRGGVQAGPDLIKGDIHAMFEILPTQIGNIKAGKVRALAITSAQRNPQIPAVPTLAEVGVSDFQVGVWYGLYAPRGTPKPVVHALEGAAATVLGSPELQQRLAQLGAEATPDGPAGLASLQRSELERWTSVIRTSGATSE